MILLYIAEYALPIDRHDHDNIYKNGRKTPQVLFNPDKDDSIEITPSIITEAFISFLLR